MKQTNVRELDSGEQLLHRTFHDSINVSSKMGSQNACKWPHMAPLCNLLAVHMLRKSAHKSGNGPHAGWICLCMFFFKELRHFGHRNLQELNLFTHNSQKIFHLIKHNFLCTGQFPSSKTYRESQTTRTGWRSTWVSFVNAVERHCGLQVWSKLLS